MSTCWKCGKTLPDGQTECEYGCGQDAKLFSDVTDQEVREAARRVAEKTKEIDYDKIQSVDDMKAFLRALFGTRIFFPAAVPEAMKRFLKEGE